MQTIAIASKSANSRFFTDYYPNSAVFAPFVDQIPPQIGLWGGSTDPEHYN
jgi:hypothetical protein